MLSYFWTSPYKGKGINIKIYQHCQNRIGFGIAQKWSESVLESNRAHPWNRYRSRNRPSVGQGISIGIGTENPGIADSCYLEKDKPLLPIPCSAFDIKKDIRYLPGVALDSHFSEAPNFCQAALNLKTQLMSRQSHVGIIHP